MSLSRVEEQTVRALVEQYGFPRHRCEEAVRNITIKSDVQLACEWLLDHGEEDKGGAVRPVHCPHLDDLRLALIDRSRVAVNDPCVSGCESKENWLCLCCGETRCGRYVNGHSLSHHKETKAHDERQLTVDEASRGITALGHFISISLGDVSVWCYECNSYVDHPRTDPFVDQVRHLKFGSPPAAANKRIRENVSVGDPIQASHTAMHGSLGDPNWAAPTVAVVCPQQSRPNYKSGAAHEYLDSPQVLEAKVRILANLILKSQNCIAYTGAGISTASGIADYATRSSQSVVSDQPRPSVSPINAPPTVSHRILTDLFRHGYLKHWIQQNHDGLPQKAGFPQEHINEIHGAWFDPTNPVVAMSGTLRPDLLQLLTDWEEKSDLCLAMGTSMCGMNSDRVAVTPAMKHRSGEALGTVVVSLQTTQYDHLSTLRIFATIDTVMQMLACELNLTPGPVTTLTPSVPEEELASHVFTNLPYNSQGKRDAGCSLTLDLRIGKKVRLVNQPDWDLERAGNEGDICNITSEGHVVVMVAYRERVMGVWWLEAAKRGTVEYIPLVNVE